METYVKLADIKALLKQLYNEPEYQHEGETFYAGICAVEDELDNLSSIKLD